MGTDITIVAQKKNGDQWVEVDTPSYFDDRFYGRFAWMADVRNYSAITPILPDQRGKPDDFQSDRLSEMWGCSWLSMDEIRAVDFDQIIEDRRCMINGNGGSTCPMGEGEKMTLREFLGPNWVSDLLNLDADRIVFGFDC